VSDRIVEVIRLGVATKNPTCKHCGDPVAADERSHWAEGYGHEGVCCDCMDLQYGMPLDALNAERAAKGRAPITKPWPGLDESGETLT
jgi:hypothetical protein